MRFIQISLALVFLFSAAQSFAGHEHKNGPCSAYEATCESDASVTSATDKKAKWAAKHACIAAAAKADTANGQACADRMAKHDEKHAH